MGARAISHIAILPSTHRYIAADDTCYYVCTINITLQFARMRDADPHVMALPSCACIMIVHPCNAVRRTTVAALFATAASGVRSECGGGSEARFAERTLGG